MSDTEKNPHAVALGKMGGEKIAEAKGSEYFAELQSLRKQRKGGRPKNPPRATHDGVLEIGDLKLECAVLEDGSRVISETKFMAAMGMYRSGALSVRRKGAGAPIPLYLAHKNLKPFVDKHLDSVHFGLIPYKSVRGASARGIPAETLPKVCEVWMDAKNARVLGQRQLITAQKAEMLLRALAHVGIIALIDEATGYQEIRDKQALQAILDQFLEKEFAAWAKRFPDEFYKQMFRLKGWEWKGMKVNRKWVVGKFTKDLVYERLAPGIVQELEKKNPKDRRGRRKVRHHQWLTEDIGHPALAQHLHALIGLMRASDNWQQFHQMVERAFPKRGETLYLPLSTQYQ